LVEIVGQLFAVRQLTQLCKRRLLICKLKDSRTQRVLSRLKIAVPIPLPKQLECGNESGDQRFGRFLQDLLGQA